MLMMYMMINILLTNYINVTKKKKREIFKFLDSLRESGKTNMFGSAQYILIAYPELSKSDARNILSEWMITFDERHKCK